MNVGSHPWHFSMLVKKAWALREGILTKRMPANQRVETRGGKKVGKEREVVSLQKGAPKRNPSPTSTTSQKKVIE